MNIETGEISAGRSTVGNLERRLEKYGKEQARCKERRLRTRQNAITPED